MKDFRASRETVDAFGAISGRLGRVRYELETVRDVETASLIVRELQESATGLAARIVILDDGRDEAGPQTSRAPLRERKEAPPRRGMRARIPAIATYVALFATGAAAAMALQLGEALAGLLR